MPDVRYGRRTSDRLRPWRLVGLVVVVLASSGLMAWAVTGTVNRANDRAATASQQAGRAGQQAVQASQLAKAIQGERYDAILASCEAQNRRHIATIRALDRVLARALRAPLSRARRVEIRASRASTLLLINALAPYQPSCAAVAMAATGATP